jgi:rhodanese-related sulfurtransferase
MDTIAYPVSIPVLHASLGSPRAPLLIDVRRSAAYEVDDRAIASAIWCDPFSVADWNIFLPRHRQVVVYCVHGHEISQNVCAALRATGLDARYLDGGIETWKAQRLPCARKQAALGLPAAPNAGTKWVTRERPKIDRIACPWLIRRFIDPLARFIYVAATDVASTAIAQNAIAYDVPGVQFTHRDDSCSFDALIADFGIDDPALHALANIVRGADTGMPGLTPQSPGLLAISLGLSALYADDLAMLEQGMIVYDALFAWLKHASGEGHNADLFRARP